MSARGLLPSVGVLLACAALPILGDEVIVRHNEGLVHGFVTLRDLENTLLASGELSQVSTGARITNELSLHFKDGSLHEESYVFTQQRIFQLISYHLIQKGPTFKRPIEMSVNASTGQVTVRYTDDDGKPQVSDDHMRLPPDIANGLVTTMLNDLDQKPGKTTVSMVAPTPKPRLVKLEISTSGEDEFTVGNISRKARRYVIKVNIGGISGVIAPIIGKQPPDTYVWMVGGKAPGFLKSEGPLYDGGPVWRIELTSPVWRPDADRKR